MGAWAHAGVRSMINAQRRVEEVQIDGLALLKLVR